MTSTTNRKYPYFETSCESEHNKDLPRNKLTSCHRGQRDFVLREFSRKINRIKTVTGLWVRIFFSSQWIWMDWHRQFTPTKVIWNFHSSTWNVGWSSIRSTICNLSLRLWHGRGGVFSFIHLPEFFTIPTLESVSKRVNLNWHFRWIIKDNLMSVGKNQ